MSYFSHTKRKTNESKFGFAHINKVIGKQKKIVKISLILEINSTENKSREGKSERERKRINLTLFCT